MRITKRSIQCIHLDEPRAEHLIEQCERLTAVLRLALTGDTVAIHQLWDGWQRPNGRIDLGVSGVVYWE